MGPPQSRHSTSSVVSIRRPICEAQAFIAQPTFLADLTETKLCTNLIGASLHALITFRPKAIQYLLRTYTPSSAITDP